MKNVLTFLPINIGKLVEPTPHSRWFGFSFLEQVLDWSILPENCWGKLYVKLKDASQPQSEQMKGFIEVRLAFTQDPQLHGLAHPMYGGAEFIVKGSEIRHTGDKKWQLKESQWFKLPRLNNISCLWIQGRADEGTLCAVQLANLAIAEE